MPSQPITIVIADDHAVVRQGLRLLLEAEDDLAVVGESSDIARDERRCCASARRPWCCSTSTWAATSA